MFSGFTSVFHQSTYESEFDTPHMIVTYTALISLAILRDDFTRLDRRGLVAFLRSSQREDGRSALAPVVACWANKPQSFTSNPTGGDTDLRLTYCAFVICTLLNDWSGVNVDRALGFVRRCRVNDPLSSCMTQLTLRFTRPTKAVTALRRDAKHKVCIAGCPIRG